MIHSALVFGCGGEPTRRESAALRPARTVRVEVTMGRDVNAGHPVRVALVVPHTEATDARVAELTAPEWFAAAEQIEKDAPGEIDRWTWEWIPDECPAADALVDCIERPRVVETITIPAGRRAIAFARYLRPGPDRATAPDGDALRLIIGVDGPEWTPSPEQTRRAER